METTMKQAHAKAILNAIEAKDTDKLNELKVSVYGNKGRMWSNTACITDLDEVKGQCNPRLAFNSCDVENIGCPECLAKLKELAA